MSEIHYPYADPFESVSEAVPEEPPPDGGGEEPPADTEPAG